MKFQVGDLVKIVSTRINAPITVVNMVGQEFEILDIFEGEWGGGVLYFHTLADDADGFYEDELEAA